jgi:hypothetical protein
MIRYDVFNVGGNDSNFNDVIDIFFSRMPKSVVGTYLTRLGVRPSCSETRRYGRDERQTLGPNLGAA